MNNEHTLQRFLAELQKSFVQHAVAAFRRREPIAIATEDNGEMQMGFNQALEALDDLNRDLAQGLKLDLDDIR